MSSAYSTNLKIELIGTGEQSGTWGSTTNTNLGTALEQAIVGYGNPNFTSDADLTISLTDSNATQTARNLALNVTSSVSLTATRNLIVPTIQKPYMIYNNTTGSQSIVVKTSAGTGITVPNGYRIFVYVDGTNVVQALNYLSSVTIAGGTITGITDLAVADGGTGASTAAGARTNLGAAASGANSDITSLSGLTTALSVAQGGTGSTTLTANNVLLGNGTSAVQAVAPGTSGNVLTSNGTTWASSALTLGALKYDLFTSSTTWTCPTGVTRVQAICIAGGGGGSSLSGGDDGGHGGVATGVYTVVPGTGYSVTVGAGGAGSTSGAASAGGSSAFASFCSATGGGGGNGSGGAGGEGAGSGGTFANTSVASAQGIGVFGGSLSNQVASTSAVTWTAASGKMPGAKGSGSTASGGYSGAILLQYVG